MNHATVAISGFSSEVGKTSLMCELLRALPGWEAIKMTRGHYRSCGKDPHACCVSHLLSDEPVIRSGRAQTYTRGKDTGRYWDAGASNVHWVIVTDNQVEKGIKLAFDRVQATGVLIEGNSFLNFIDVDFAIMVARAGSSKVKTSARRVLSKSTALYLFNDNKTLSLPDGFVLWHKNFADKNHINNLPVYTRDTLSQLISRVRAIHSTSEKQ